MKPIKPPQRLQKSSRSSSSPVRKPFPMKKSGISRSPNRGAGYRSSRPLSPRPSSPPRMKRLPPPSFRKRSRSPHRRSPPHRPVSSHSPPMLGDRARNKKREFVKRRSSSLSPIARHSPTPPRPLAQQSHIASYQPGRYPESRPDDRRYGSPPKKKSSREPDRFRRSPSSPIGRGPPLAKSHVPQRSDGNVSSHPIQIPSVLSQVHHPASSRDRPSSFTGQSVARLGYNDLAPANSHAKEQPISKPSYSGRDEPFKRGDSRGGDHYPPPSDKQYGTTLDERFRSVSETSRVAEPRIHYTREDLEKITIDIHRNLRDHSPTVRRILNPADVKIVRRPGEGRRPIFDREEIKQAPRDLRDDSYFEHKMMSSIRETGMSAYGLNLREIENYEITRHRFDMYHQPISTTSGRSLSDRWQNLETRKDGPGLDRDERDHEYERPPLRDFPQERQPRSRSTDRDFRSDRYSGGVASHSKSDYSASQQHRAPSSSSLSLSVRKKDEPLPDARQRIMDRRGGGDRDTPPPRQSGSSHHMQSDRRYSGENSGGSAGNKGSRASEDRYHQPRISMTAMMARKNKILSLDEKMKVIQAITVQKLTVKKVEDMFECGRSQIYDALRNRDDIKHEWVKGRHLSSSSRHGSGLEAPHFEVRPRESSKDDKLPDFSRRPDKYNYKPWLEKPDVTPKGPSYFEHDNRERSSTFRSRSGSRPFRSSRGSYRGRGFTRSPRGIRTRGSYRGRGFSTSFRPRGLSSRRQSYLGDS